MCVYGYECVDMMIEKGMRCNIEDTFKGRGYNHLSSKHRIASLRLHCARRCKASLDDPFSVPDHTSSFSRSARHGFSDYNTIVIIYSIGTDRNPYPTVDLTYKAGSLEGGLDESKRDLFMIRSVSVSQNP